MKKQSFISRMFAKKESAPAAQLADDLPVENNADPKIILVQHEAQGSSGSYNYAGYPSEEYLAALRGVQRADLFDKMRRSEPEIKMVLSAVKNPIKAATWDIEPSDDSERAQFIADFVKHVLFEDMDKTWRSFLGEALTMIDFGHSVFEVTHKVVTGHPKFGSYNGIRSLGWRSPRTIQRFHLDKDTGKLLKVAQYAYGDLYRLVDLPAQFLVVFSMDKEGDNYEGVSMLRPCYGPWQRKQLYLKLMAIGIEKFAVPTPVGKVPAGKVSSDQQANFKASLQAWSSHESNALTIPEGWNVEFIKNDFDPAKVQVAIDGENREIVKAFLANFLELGMGSTSSGGSYALAFNHLDFFLGAEEHIAHGIEETVNSEIIQKLIDLNFGPQTAYPKLKHSGISDRGGKELAESLRFLSDSKIIEPDDQLEENVRKRFNLTKKSDIGRRQGGKDSGGGLVGMAETRADRITLAEKNARSQIGAGKSKLKDLMQAQLKLISDDLISQVMSKVRRLPESQQLSAIKNLDLRGVRTYRAQLTQLLSEISASALAQARKEVPKKRNVRLAGEHGIRLAEIDDLPPALQEKIKAQAGLLTDSQLADLEKAVYFQYTHSVSSTDSDAILKSDMEESADEFIAGSSIDAGAGNTTALLVNEARNSFFFDDDVITEIESFDFVNGDPQSPICQDLAGTTFDKDDPEAERYFPPLHHNCKSYIVPNLVGNRHKDVESLRPSSPELEGYITLSERGCRHK